MKPILKLYDSIMAWWGKDTLIKVILQIAGISAIIVGLLLSFGVIISLLLSLDIPFVKDIKSNGFDIAFAAGGYIVTTVLLIRDVLDRRETDKRLIEVNRINQEKIDAAHKEKERVIGVEKYRINKLNLCDFIALYRYFDINTSDENCNMLMYRTIKKLIFSLSEVVPAHMKKSFKLLNYKLNEIGKVIESNDMVLIQNLFDDLYIEIDHLLLELDEIIS